MNDPLPGDIFQTGQILNNTYEVEGILGRGGTGEVYRAKNLISGRVVALKAMSASFSGNEDYLELMNREEQMRDILHDAVVRYYDSSRTDDGHVYLVMDFVDGRPVSDALARGGMEPRDLLVIAHHVAEGLAVTHKRQIVHRDLSPDNIILRDGDPSQAVIIDFGIAKDNSVKAKTIVGNTFAGKYEYAAPEQVDGRAEPRSDLYALGATLLATFRGEVPFQGATPGEIIRRKSAPLDTSAVPEPLKGIIDWITAPDPDDRPRNAEQLVSKLDEVLKLRKSTSAKAKRKGGFGKWGLGAGILAALGAAAYFLIVKPSALPEQKPYTLLASLSEQGDGSLRGYAPDDRSRDALIGAFKASSGVVVATDSIGLATGMPDAAWLPAVQDLLVSLEALDDWEFEIEDHSATISGVAPSKEVRDRVINMIQATANAAGISLNFSILVGPRNLTLQTLEEALTSISDCGPLEARPPDGGNYPMDGEIVITGKISDQSQNGRINEALSPSIGGRNLRLETNVLNPDICRVRQVMPDVGTGDLSIWLGHGDTNETNLAGIYHIGENPVAEAYLPESIQAGYLWVFIVDNSDKVYHVLPSEKRTVHAISELGSVDAGIRKIRLLLSEDEIRSGVLGLGFRVTARGFGKSEIYAILTDKQLFEGRRPADESIDGFIEAFVEEITKSDVKFLGMATRLIDARP